MKPKILLRIAAGLLMFHALGHALGHSTWKKTIDPVKREVINQMTSHEFEFMGEARSMGDYYEGYGFSMIFVLLMMTAIVWLVSGSVSHPRTSAKVLIPVLFCLLAFTVIDSIFFFALPALICLAAAVLIGFSIFQLRKVSHGRRI